MALSKTESKQLLERLVFDETAPKDWVQDVWDLGPLQGEGAARLWQAFESVVECCSAEKLENLVQSLYQEREPDQWQ